MSDKKMDNKSLVSLMVLQDTRESRLRAEDLSAYLNVPVTLPTANGIAEGRMLESNLSSFVSDSCSTPFSILITNHQLMLKNNKVNQHPLVIDFSSGSSYSRRLKGSGTTQLLAKAIGIKQGARPDVLDCTAGLARDAYWLAGMGCHVIMLERSSIIAVLIEDALSRAKLEAVESEYNNGENIAARLSLIEVDAKDYLKDSRTKSVSRNTVIYIDTMFPERKKTAQIKGEMQLLQGLLGKEDEAEVLVKIALEGGYRRVVVKRPAKGSWQDALKPHHVIKGKTIRFDVFMQS